MANGHGQWLAIGPKATNVFWKLDAAAGGPGGSARDRDAALERLVRTAPWGTAASTPFAFL